MANLIRSITLALLLLTAARAGAAPSGMGREMLAEVNLARTAPQRYAQQLRDLRPRYVGKGFWAPGSSTMTITREGVAALDEAIALLQKQVPLPALSWSPGLAKAAEDLARDQAASGGVGHSGPSGDMQARIERHGSWSGRIGEIVGYGPDTARLMVIQLIVDDDVPGRGHRKNILSAAFKTAGAACGAHPEYRRMCVMDFATGFKGKN